MVFQRACLLFGTVASLLGCGAPPEGNGDPTIPPPTGNGSGHDEGGEEPELDCGPTFADDLVLAYGDRSEAPAEIRRVVAVGDVAVVGGEGFAAVLDSDGELGDALALEVAVTALAAIDDDTVAIGTSDGEVIVANVDGGELSPKRTVSAGARVHGLASDGDTIFVALGSEGLRTIDVSGGEPTAFGSVSTANGVAFAGARVVVAAASEGVVVLDAEGGLVGSVPTDTIVYDVIADGDRAIALRGTQGWDIVALDGPPELLTSMTTGGVSMHAAFTDDGLLVVDGWAVTRFAIDGDDVEPIGVEPRRDTGDMAGTWLRGIARHGDGFVVVDDAAAIPLDVRDEEDAPNITVDVPSFGAWGEAGETVEAAYLVRNVGTEDLLVGSVAADGDFTASLQKDVLEEHGQCDGYFVVPAGATALVNLEFEAADGPSEGTLTILTNDPDEPRLEIPLEGNHKGVREGDDAVDFTGLTLDGGLFRLSDHAGKVVFLKMFNYGCATCAEEFGEVQASLVPSFAPADFVAVGVNTSHRTAYADKVATDAGLTIPVVLDIDSAAFRHYRIPDWVFPLHIVIGRDGKIAHVNDQPGLTMVEAAIRAAM